MIDSFIANQRIYESIANIRIISRRVVAEGDTSQTSPREVLNYTFIFKARREIAAAGE